MMRQQKTKNNISDINIATLNTFLKILNQQSSLHQPLLEFMKVYDAELFSIYQALKLRLKEITKHQRSKDI